MAERTPKEIAESVAKLSNTTLERQGQILADAIHAVEFPGVAAKPWLVEVAETIIINLARQGVFIANAHALHKIIEEDA